jgi:hypothetical protein
VHQAWKTHPCGGQGHQEPPPRVLQGHRELSFPLQVPRVTGSTSQGARAPCRLFFGSPSTQEGHREGAGAGPPGASGQRTHTLRPSYRCAEPTRCTPEATRRCNSPERVHRQGGVTGSVTVERNSQGISRPASSSR